MSFPCLSAENKLDLLLTIKVFFALYLQIFKMSLHGMNFPGKKINVQSEELLKYSLKRAPKLPCFQVLPETTLTDLESKVSDDAEPFCHLSC